MSKLLSTALVLAIATSGGTAAAEAIKYTTKDNYAYAGWHSSDDCSYSSVDVSASEYASKQTGSGPISGSYVGVYYSGTNWCTGEYSSGYAYGDGNVAVSPNAVTVRASLPSWDYVSGESQLIELDLKFVGNGEYSSRGISKHTTTSGPVRTRNRHVGSSASADVTGTITLDGVNLVPAGLAWGDIGKSSHGSVEIYLPESP